jgi:hypothetical protein
MKIPDQFAGNDVPGADIASRLGWLTLAWTCGCDDEIFVDRNGIGERKCVAATLSHLRGDDADICIHDTFIAEVGSKFMGLDVDSREISFIGRKHETRADTVCSGQYAIPRP